MVRGEPDSLGEREAPEVGGEKNWRITLIDLKEIPAVFVRLESTNRNARALDRGVALPHRRVGVREPVHVLNPGRSRDVDARDHEVARAFTEIERYRHHHEVLALVKTRPLRLGTQRPAHGGEITPPRRFNLHLHKSPVASLSEHSENVGALQTITSKSGRPASSGQLSGDMMLTDCLSLFRVSHALRLSSA